MKNRNLQRSVILELSQTNKFCFIIVLAHKNTQVKKKIIF